MEYNLIEINLSTTKIANFSQFNNPCISINRFESLAPCENLNIGELLYHEKMDLTKIKNNKIKSFRIPEDISILKKLKNFDFTQVEGISISGLTGNKNFFLYFLYRKCKLIWKNEYIESFEKTIKFVSLLIFSNIYLLDSTLFQDIEKFM